MFRRATPLVFAACTALVFVALLPFLAVAAHSGDGAELVVAARHGAVLHPPGFPLQMWLDRVAIHLPFGPSDAWRVSVVSAIGHALAVAFIVDALRRLRAGVPARIVGAAAFAFFPSCLALAVQPEAFALAFAGVAASIDVVLAARDDADNDGEGALRDAAVAGLVSALCLAQHTITVVAAPAWLVAAFLIVRRRSRHPKLVVTSVGVGAFAASYSVLYGSLLAVAGTRVWPDWGKLSSLSDLWRHMTRAEYGVLDLMATPGATERRAITVLVEQVASTWSLAALLVVVGAAALWAALRPEPNRVASIIGVLGTIGAALAFLAIAVARTQPGSAPDDATLERFLGTAVVPLAVLMGLGFHALTLRLAAWVPRLRRGGGGGVAAWLVVACLVAGSFALNAPVALGAHDDRTSDVVLEATARTLRELPGAVYLSSTDLEVLAGVPDDGTGGGRRFPVKCAGSLAPWYVRDVLPAIEPRLGVGPFPDEASIVRASLALGVPVVMSNDRVFDALGDVPFELRGVVFVAGAGVAQAPGSQVSTHTIDAALALCPLIEELDALPLGAHDRIRGFRVTLARAFEGAGYALASQPGRAAVARAIADGLAASTDPRTWREGCRALGESNAP